MTTYRVFSRRSWKENPAWPDGYEPDPRPPEDCATISKGCTREEAREICEDHNATRNRLIKDSPMYEFTEE